MALALLTRPEVWRGKDGGGAAGWEISHCPAMIAPETNSAAIVIRSGDMMQIYYVSAIYVSDLILF